MTSSPEQAKREQTERLIALLGHHDAIERLAAREGLVAMGPQVAPRLIEAVQHGPGGLLRWEAAKALVELRSAEAAPHLAAALRHEDEDIRWIAAEGLIALGDAGVVAVLEALLGPHAPESTTWVRRGAHHVLRAFTRPDDAELLRPVVVALEILSSEEQIPVSAHEVLKAWRTRKARRAD